MTSGEDWWDGRSKLNLAYTRDAEHWQNLLQMENKEKGEYSYPAIIQSKNGHIHITYTYNRKKIKYFELKKL